MVAGGGFKPRPQAPKARVLSDYTTPASLLIGGSGKNRTFSLYRLKGDCLPNRRRIQKNRPKNYSLSTNSLLPIMVAGLYSGLLS